LTLGAYLAFDGEPDLEPALLELRNDGFRIALPVLEGPIPPSMSLRIWTNQTPLQPNRFGIREPLAGKPVGLDALDVLLMPLVAYDARGVRLGVGGGYYDRLLSNRAPGAGPERVGVAYSRQQALTLPREEWDVPLNAILNENGWFAFPL
jgi:5-formyltetrahydrofolate cyclo-ligase